MGKTFVSGMSYHILNRGVEKRKIFLNDKDRIRFIHDLYEFNDINPALKYETIELQRRDNDYSRPRERLVDVQCFSLMPNHHHLICRQLKENGISLFMKKIHGGYARGFNEKHKRVGHLFQGKSKTIPISNEKYLMHLVCYIHANPLDLWRPRWKEEGLSHRELNEALDFLGSYRWSSYLDFIGKKNFPSVIKHQFILDIFGGEREYLLFFRDWLKFYRKNISVIDGYTLD